MKVATISFCRASNFSPPPDIEDSLKTLSNEIGTDVITKIIITPINIYNEYVDTIRIDVFHKERVDILEGSRYNLPTLQFEWVVSDNSCYYPFDWNNYSDIYAEGCSIINLGINLFGALVCTYMWK